MNHSSHLSEEPPSYMLPAIIVTVAFCVPFGLIALIFAGQADGLVKAGDNESAWDHAESAKNWCWISFALAIASWLLLLMALLLVPN